jgi:hypothetical protein
MVPSRRLEQVQFNLKKASIDASEKLGDGRKDYSTKIFPANYPEACATTGPKSSRTNGREHWSNALLRSTPTPASAAPRAHLFELLSPSEVHSDRSDNPVHGGDFAGLQSLGHPFAGGGCPPPRQRKTRPRRKLSNRQCCIATDVAAARRNVMAADRASRQQHLAATVPTPGKVSWTISPWARLDGRIWRQ